MRLIDADAFLEEARNRIDMQDMYLPIHIKYFVIDEMPTIDAEPIRHGKWIDVKGSNGKDYRKCSECLHTQDITGLLNYCPVCGAKMEGEEE